jgi:hypothetical protein
MAKVRQGCANIFSKVTPGDAFEVGTKLKPGSALPHVTLPTTEVRVSVPAMRELACGRP